MALVPFDSLEHSTFKVNDDAISLFLIYLNSLSIHHFKLNRVQRIDRATVDKIYDVARVEEIVGDYVSLKRRGTNMLGLCPFHDEKTPSFMVSPSKGIYKCFGCGKGGNAINFVMELEQLSYYDALKQVAGKYHVHIEEKELSEEEKRQFSDRDSMMILNEFSRKYFTEQMMETAEGRTVGLSYFKQRGFTDQIIEKFQLGFAPDGKDIFTQEAIRQGYKQEYLEKTGLSIIKEDWRRDRFGGRVIFPIHGQSGKVVAFAGRTLSTDKKIAKYLNSPESEIYHKSSVLYGIYHAKKDIQRKDNCFLVEGYTDVMSLHQSGIENVVASSGTSLTQGQIKLIQRFTENVTVIYDGDNAGIKASLRGIDLILEQGLNIKVLLLPDGEDPDSFAKSMGASELVDYIEKNSTDFIHFKTNLLMKGAANDPIKMANLIQEIMKSISVIPSEIKRTIYIKSCSSLLDVPEDMLLRESGKLVQANQQNRFKEAERKMNRQRSQPRQSQPMGGPPPDGPPVDFGLPDDLPSMDASAVAAMPPPVEVTHPAERALVEHLLRYGEMKMFKEGDEYFESYPDYLVSDYIISQLDDDGLQLVAVSLDKIMKEYKSLKTEGRNNLQRHFAHHEDVATCQLVVDLISDKHERSRVSGEFIPTTEQQLSVVIPRVLAEFKLFWVKGEMKTQFDILQTEKDDAKANEAMLAYQQLKNVQTELSKSLGNRTVLG